jgi:hypothetical protein
MSRSVRKQYVPAGLSRKFWFSVVVSRKEQAAAAEKETAEGLEVEQDEEEVVEPTAGWQEIDKLQDLGVNVADIKKLKAGGCHTVASLLMHTRKVGSLPAVLSRAVPLSLAPRV